MNNCNTSSIIHTYSTTNAVHGTILQTNVVTGTNSWNVGFNSGASLVLQDSAGDTATLTKENLDDILLLLEIITSSDDTNQMIAGIKEEMNIMRALKKMGFKNGV